MSVGKTDRAMKPPRSYVVPPKDEYVFWRSDTTFDYTPHVDAVDISEKGDKGLHKRIIIEALPAVGDGDDFPTDGDTVFAHYVGTLLDDGKQFDSACGFSFVLGQGRVIRAWEVGVATMRKGEKCELYCRADYAYGNAGSPPAIPPNASLKFEIEVVSWERVRSKPASREEQRADDDKSMGMSKGFLSSGQRLYPEGSTEAAVQQQEREPDVPETEDVLRKSSEVKAAGTVAFKASNWPKAIAYYEAALGLLDDVDITFGTLDGKPDTTLGDADKLGNGDEREAEAAALRLSCQLNIAQCHLNMSEWHRAVSVCTQVLDGGDADSVKALYRRGMARMRLCDFGAARTDMRRACELQPSNKEVRAALVSLREAERRAQETDKAVFARMVAGAGGKEKGITEEAVGAGGQSTGLKKSLDDGEELEGEEEEVIYFQ